jgi:signal transduction histidine kinase
MQVRTPLNAIINYLEIALESDLNDSTKEAISVALGSSKSLIFIINDLLDLTRIEAGKMLFREEPFNLKETIVEAVEMFRADASRKNIDFILIISEEIPETVIGDCNKLRQVF